MHLILEFLDFYRRFSGYGYLVIIVLYRYLVCVQKTQQASCSFNSYCFEMKCVY